MANPSPDPPITNENDLRAKAIKRIKGKRDFQNHLIVFVIVNTALWLIWARINQKADTNDLLIIGTYITGIWLVILVIDAFRVYGERQALATLLPLPLPCLPISDEEISKEMRRMQGG
jgi:hypothetical protein